MEAIANVAWSMTAANMKTQRLMMETVANGPYHQALADKSLWLKKRVPAAGNYNSVFFYF